MKIKRPRIPHPLNILLTNGRFPVSLDLARQLKRAGHFVFCVDPMEYHVCKFSNAVKKSWQVPVPRLDTKGYIDAVRKAVDEVNVDLIIPVHEEVFFLAQCDDAVIKGKLFAPPFEVLLLLHNKWEFNQFLNRIGLASPKSTLCKSLSDVRDLLSSVEYDIALKPVFGRSASKVHHLHPGQVIPDGSNTDTDTDTDANMDIDIDIDVGPANHYIAQEWIRGTRYCSYSVVREGRTQAFGLYPVKDTLDGSSCVYFASVEHPAIREYTERILSALRTLGYPRISGQFAYDFVESESGDGGTDVVAIECNPRATSGIHLFAGKARLGRAFTCDFAAAAASAGGAVTSNPKIGPSTMSFASVTEALTGTGSNTSSSGPSNTATATAGTSGSESESGSRSTEPPSTRFATRMSENTNSGARRVDIDARSRSQSQNENENGNTKSGPNSDSSSSSTSTSPSPSTSTSTSAPAPAYQVALAKPGRTRQVAPGMILSPKSSRGHGLRAYLSHQKRLLSTKDVVFTTSDLLPTLMQPFLLTSYYEICRERGMWLKDMFQWDVAWEPGEGEGEGGQVLEEVRRRMDVLLVERVGGVFGGDLEERAGKTHGGDGEELEGREGSEPEDAVKETQTRS